MWIDSHGFQPIVDVTKLCHHERVATPAVSRRIGMLEPVFVSSQMTADKERMVEASRKMTARRISKIFVS